LDTSGPKWWSAFDIWRGTLKKYSKTNEPYKGLKIVVKGKAGAPTNVNKIAEVMLYRGKIQTNNYNNGFKGRRSFHAYSPKDKGESTLDKKGGGNTRLIFILYILMFFMALLYLIILIYLLYYPQPDLVAHDLILNCRPSGGGNASDAIRGDIQYFQDQAKLYLEAKNTLNIPESEWTDTQREVVEELKQIGEYDEKAIREGYMDNIKAVQDNIKKLSSDSVAESSNIGKRATDSNYDSSNKGRRV